MAKITLRKANTLQQVLNDLMKSIEIKIDVRINEFQNPEEILAEANRVLLSNDSRRNDLLMSIYSLRSLVGAQNAASGISSKLAHAAFIDKRLAQLQGLTESTHRLTMDVVKGKLDKIKNSAGETRSRLYGYEEEVTVAVLNAEQVEGVRGVIRDLKKQKQAINDEVLELNVRTEIQLPPDVEAVLTREGLL